MYTFIRINNYILKLIHHPFIPRLPKHTLCGGQASSNEEGKWGGELFQ